MFAVDGYESLKVFTRAATGVIWERVQGEDARRWREAIAKGEAYQLRMEKIQR
ncbi:MULTISPECIES: hypothetical protein [Rhizobium]|uniref:hypothetical protein n=1 Tax=Rhizobium TaxID=379 RepID=UPI00130019DE|nr:MULTISPECIES: hypothetical protein [Rhizobium]MCS0461631.1 hypothetical protein [Rhizobium favelukesii]UFS82065.1 hypothetical protein LPB79_27915 [Rhizobium sp. T136]